MESLNLDQYLFHGIESYKSSFFYNGRYVKEEEEARILKQILNTGFLASRKLLKDILSEEEYKLLVMLSDMNWNGEKYVSIVPTSYPQIGGIDSALDDSICQLEDSRRKTYNYYVTEHASLVLDAKLLRELPVNHNPGPKMAGEIQIEEKIPSDYFIGVTLPELTRTDAFLNYLMTGDESIEIGYQSWYENAQVDILRLTEEEFVQKYYKKVILFEEVLKEANSNLKLYHTETGKPIMTSTERMEQIKKFKKKCL